MPELHTAVMQRIAVVLGLVALLWLITQAEGPRKQLTNADAALEKTPKLLLWRGSNDVDRTISVEVSDRDAGTRLTGELLERENGIFTDRTGNTRATVQRRYYFVSPGLDIGAIAGFRPASRGTDSDSFAVGLRLSPARVFFNAVSPDVAFTKDWIGGGISVYPPTRLVGPDWARVGIGTWYGYPYRGSDSGGPGWTFGLSLSIRE